MSIKSIDERLKIITQISQELIVHNNDVNSTYVHPDKIIRPGLRFNLDVSCSCYGYDEEDKYHKEWENRERNEVSIIVSAPHNVFVNTINSILGIEKQLKNYENTSNHDSCWRTDGINLHHFYYEMWKRVYANVPEDKCPNMINAHFFVWDVFHKIFQPVEIVTKGIKGDDYRDKIVALKEITLIELLTNYN